MAVGRLGRPHGVRGEIRMDPMGGLPRGLKGYDRFFTDDPGGVAPVHLESWRSHTRWLLLTLKGVMGRDEAARWTGKTLYVPREDLPPLEEGEYYHADVIGCGVFDEADAEIGRVEDIRDWGEYDMLIIRTGRKQWMLPVLDDFVLSMELDAECIRVRVPEGLGP